MKRFITSFLLAVGFSCAVFSQSSDLQPIVNVRLHKTEPITLKQIKVRIEALQKEAGRAMSLDERKKIIDLLVNEKIVLQAAEKDGVRVSDSEINQNFTNMISQQLGKEVTEAEFGRIIKEQTGMSLDEFIKSQTGMSLVDYKSFLKSQLIAQRYVMVKKQKEIAAMQGPSDKEIRSYYEMNKQSFVQPDMLSMFLVVSPKGNTPEVAKKTIQDLQKQLKNKPSSKAEIKIKADQQNSKYQAGDLYINKNSTAAQQLGISMEDLIDIFAMGKNQVSEVIETDQDFHCFLVQDKYEAKILNLSDVVKPGTTTTVYEFIKNNMLLQAQNIALSTALNDLIIELKKPETVQYLKKDAELENLLKW